MQTIWQRLMKHKVAAVLIALLIVLSLTLALYLFLSEYLLYRYDHDDLPAEDFDESED